jgi:predicted nucleic acid-binding protein
MVLHRTYLDSGVLLAAWRGTPDVSAKALAVLGDPNRLFVISDFVLLETLPKAVFHKNQDEVSFMELIFENAQLVPLTTILIGKAMDVACKHNINALDALHISAAIVAQVDDFVTTEKDTKPMFAVQELQITSLHPDSS